MASPSLAQLATKSLHFPSDSHQIRVCGSPIALGLGVTEHDDGKEATE